MYYINLVDKSREMHQKNGVEAIVDSDGTFCLNEKYIEKGSYHICRWLKKNTFQIIEIIDMN